jgi:hypothetical protein
MRRTALVNRTHSPPSMLFSMPSTRMVRPQRLHSNACALDNRIKPPQVGHGTSWSVLIAVTRRALALRPERSRGPNRRSAGMRNAPHSTSRGRYFVRNVLGPALILTRERRAECDSQHKIELFAGSLCARPGRVAAERSEQRHQGFVHRGL